MDIFNIQATGVAKENFLDAVREFQRHTSYYKMFDFTECKVFHIKEEQSNSEHLELIDCLSIVDSIGSNSKKEFGISKDFIPETALDLINAKQITTLIHCNGILFFLDENCRSMIASKIGISGNYLYDSSLMADVILQVACNTYKPAGKINAKYPTAIIRTDNGINTLVSMLADTNEPVDLTQLKELHDMRFNVVNWKIDNYITVVECELAEIDGYIPSVRVCWSDAGKGLMTRYACIKKKGCKRSAILQEIKDLTINDEVELLNNLVNEANKKSSKIIKNPYQLLLTNQRFKSIGQKRLNTIVKPIFDKSMMGRKEYIDTVLLLPDRIGHINESTDINVELGIGNEIITA